MLKFALLALPLAVAATPALAETATGAGSSRDTADAATAGQVDTTEFELATGADYSAGHYGSTLDTTVWSIPVDLKVRSGRFRAQASLPYVFIKGPGQMVGGVIVATPGSTATTARSGIGDANLSAAYLLTSEHGLLPALEIGGGVKLPTAKTTIGTGEADYSVTASAYKTLAPGVMLFGSLGYSWLGSPAAYQLENGITASGGFNFRPSDNQNYGVSIAYREPVAAGLKGQAVVSPYMTYRFNPRFGLTLYGMGGLNDASPRIGAGLRLSVFQ